MNNKKVLLTEDIMKIVTWLGDMSHAEEIVGDSAKYGNAVACCVLARKRIDMIEQSSSCAVNEAAIRRMKILVENAMTNLRVCHMGAMDFS